jgi:hypothetical protein
LVLVQALTSGGAQITSQTASLIAGKVETPAQKPSCLVACFLALFFIIPAIIYLVAAGKSGRSYSFSITLTPEAQGSRVLATGQGRGLRAAQRALTSLP